MEIFSSNEVVVNNDVNEIALSSDDTDRVVSENANEPTLHGRREVRRPVQFDDYFMLADGVEPITYAEAISCENATEWQDAKDSEMNSLLENNTWTLIDKVDDVHLVDCKWVYKLKTDLHGNRKCKARLVAKGYLQQAGIDYHETFSPAACYDTIRTVLSVAASEKMSLTHFDVKTAVLYGQLDSEIYMRQPEGYSDSSTKVFKLHCSLYGLKQSPRCWNKKFSCFLQKHGLTLSEADSCLFYRNANRHKMFIVL